MKVDRSKIFTILAALVVLLASIYLLILVPARPEGQKNPGNSFRTPTGEQAKPGQYYLSQDKSALTLAAQIKTVSVSSGKVVLDATVYPENSKNKSRLQIVAFDENTSLPLFAIEQTSNDIFPISKDYKPSRIDDPETAYARLSELRSRQVITLLDLEQPPVNNAPSTVDKDVSKDLKKYLGCNQQVKSLLTGDISRLDCLSRTYQINFIKNPDSR